MADARTLKTPAAEEFPACAAAVLVTAALLWSPSTEAQSPEAATKPALASCDEFLPPRQQVGDKLVGPDQCLIASDDIVFNLNGKPFRRLERRISGTVAGFAAKQVPRFGYFNDAPDLVFTRSGNNAPHFASGDRRAQPDMGCHYSFRSTRPIGTASCSSPRMEPAPMGESAP